MDLVVAPKRYTHRQAGTCSVLKNCSKTMRSVSGAITTELKHGKTTANTGATFTIHVITLQHMQIIVELSTAFVTQRVLYLHLIHSHLPKALH